MFFFFLEELSINICNIFKCVQTRKYAHCIPLVKRTGMQIIGLSSVPRGNYNRNKESYIQSSIKVEIYIGKNTVLIYFDRILFKNIRNLILE